MLMRFAEANAKLASHLSEATAISLTRELWGHGGGPAAHLTGNPDWYTPAYIVEAAREVMGSIDIDPASCAQANKMVKAATFYTKEQDGLKHEWPGNVFINAPFAHPAVQHFAEKLVDSSQRGVTRQAVWLSNASVGSGWWQDLMRRGPVCFPHKRIRFYGPQGEGSPPLLGQSIVYLGWHCEKFVRVFSRLGLVMADVVEWWSDDEEAEDVDA